MRDRLSRLLIAGMLVGLAAAPSRAEPTLASVLAESPFSDAERKQLLTGRMAVHPLREAGTRELAVGAACLVRDRSAEKVLTPFLVDHPILPEENVRKSGVVRGDPSPDLFRDIELEPDAAAEIARYLRIRPGTELNLSLKEIDEFTAIDASPHAAENIEKVHRRLRILLASRYASYRERGLDGIPDYARAGGRHASPADELRQSTREAGLRQLTPAFERAWLDYPSDVPAEADDRYFWAGVMVDGRPSVALVHRLSLREGPRQVVGQRSFYVSHFFDAGESVVAVAPVEEGLLVLYQDRIWLDQLSGWTAHLKKALGRKFLESHVAQTIAALGVCSK